MPLGDPEVPRREGAAQEHAPSGAAEAPPDTAPTEARDGALLGRRPTALGLARLSSRRVFPPGGVELYRHLARLVELEADEEFLLVPCGRGVTTQFLAEITKAHGSGVDPNGELIAAAEARARAARRTEQLQYEQASLTDLPYQDAVFDVAIGELGLAAVDDAAAAVRELARVVKPLGKVLLLQLTWNTAVDPERHDVVVEALGPRPRLLVEWKQMLRDAGVVDLYVEDWSDAIGPLREPGSLGGLAEFDSILDRAAVLARAWRWWGWGGVKRMLEGVRSLAGPERVLGLSLIRGVKWEDPETELAANADSDGESPAPNDETTEVTWEK